MIAKNDVPDLAGDFDAREGEDDDDEGDEPPSPSQRRPACTRCVLLGKPASCRPQSTRRRTQACELCHAQRQRCSWIADHASRRSRGKRAKVEDEIYRGPAARITDRKFEGPGISEQLAVLSEQNTELIHLLRRSLEVQEKMLGIMVRAENRVNEAMGVGEKDEDEDEDEDEDGEGEEDEEEKKEDEEKRRKAIREGKKRAD
ncbi:hypothetical protein F5890DRAFT_1560256 [Lentinula detonsa]|uniref:Uncharacterized protein n=1 Tax=Lentinula detonsa TaxID=2804962 RepID=A0AA38PMU7_9AGAR|nr:hypothetical protein F5890DRAFT_1560256 [Lentinula detonsa]